MAPESPVLASWELGLRLRERREATGLTSTAAAKHARCTQGYVSDVERGKTKIAPEKLDALLAAYELADEEVAELRELRARANTRGWWQAYSGIFDQTVLRYIGCEHGAESVQTHETLLIPGLLQTEAYGRALFHGTPNYRLTEVDPRIEARLARQRRLFDEEPLHLTAVVNEGALRQQVGGPEVLKAQLRHLLEVAEERSGNVDIRVVPFAAGGYDGLGASTYHLLDFPGARLPSLLYLENLTIMEIAERPDLVRQYSYALREALDLALSSHDSLALIKRVETEL